jgi:phosphate transport system permease protein
VKAKTSGLRYILRKIVNGVMLVLSGLSALFGLFWLFWILGVLADKGGAAINWAFFTQLPTPPGMGGGGLANAIVGTLILTALATAIGVPVGLMAGTYLSEYGRQSALGHTVRFIADVMTSAPSIVIGVFVYALMVEPMKGFSGLAGGVALAIIMIPVVTRTTEEMLRLVPNTLRESALALGAPYWKVVVRVCYRRVFGGLMTGILLAIARVSGETAPLLFTSLNNPYWSLDLTKPMGTLNVTIFNYAMSPYDDWRAKAWGAALLIALGVLLTTVLARVVVARTQQGRT